MVIFFPACVSFCYVLLYGCVPVYVQAHAYRGQGLALGISLRVSIAVKRHHDHRNSFIFLETGFLWVAWAVLELSL